EQAHAVPGDDRMQLEDDLVDLRAECGREAATTAEPDPGTAVLFELTHRLEGVSAYQLDGGVGTVRHGRGEDDAAQMSVGIRDAVGEPDLIAATALQDRVEVSVGHVLE